jgi:hypothetical protein
MYLPSSIRVDGVNEMSIISDLPKKGVLQDAFSESDLLHEAVEELLHKHK